MLCEGACREMSRDLSHFDADGNARMVDVGEKPVTRRTAEAAANVKIRCETAELIKSGSSKKGDVLGTARLAGIMACKQTPTLIPLCHNIQIDAVDIQFLWSPATSNFVDLEIRAAVSNTGNTGVEMEAMTAVTVSALTVYDMCKSVDRSMEIENIRLISKTGGASGDFLRTATEKD